MKIFRQLKAKHSTFIVYKAKVWHGVNSLVNLLNKPNDHKFSIWMCCLLALRTMSHMKKKSPGQWRSQDPKSGRVHQGGGCTRVEFSPSCLKDRSSETNGTSFLHTKHVYTPILVWVDVSLSDPLAFSKWLSKVSLGLLVTCMAILCAHMGSLSVSCECIESCMLLTQHSTGLCRIGNY